MDRVNKNQTWVFNTRDYPIEYRSDGARMSGHGHVKTDVSDPVTKAALERGILVVALNPFRSSDIEVISESSVKPSAGQEPKGSQVSKKQRSQTSAAVAKES